MENKIFSKTLLAATLVIGFDASAATDYNVKLSGQGRVRAEAKTNADYRKGNPDRTSFTASRFRLNFSAKPANSKASVFVQPQMTKVWGQNEINAEASNTTASDQSSGALNDTGVDFHQAYIDFAITDDLTLRSGRQEINFGDQLVIGAVGWHNTGRSFDGFNGTYSLGQDHNIHMATLKLIDQNISATGDGDLKVHTVYYAGSFGPNLKNLDLYFMDKSDHRGVTNNDIYTFGLRAKSNIDDFDYRFEYNIQRGRLVDGIKRNSEGQYDLELGYKISAIRSRFAVEYFSASQNYDQMLPTGHKWLGYADQFSRRNIKGYAAHWKTNFSDKFAMKLDYHVFERVKENQAAYNFSGSSLGTTGKSKKIADEIDLGLTYSVDKNLKLAAGYSLVGPKKYLKDQNAENKDKTRWSYFQILANF